MSQKQRNAGWNRRGFLAVAGIGGSGLGLPMTLTAMPAGEPLQPAKLLGGLRTESGECPLPGATWYVAHQEKDGLEYRFPAGRLAEASMIASDMLLDGYGLCVWALHLQEGEDGRRFRLVFGALNQCSFRMRFQLELVDQRQWLIDREGAFLKPMCGGDRVDLQKVDRMTLTLLRKPAETAKWCMTPLVLSSTEVPRLTDVVLPKGPLLDELGQSRLRDWPGKTRSAEEVQTRIRGQLAQAPEVKWPAGFSRWGGDRRRRLMKAPGFFRTHNDGKRWWLVDPDGFAFWSAGADCVRVDADARVDGLESALTWIPPRDGEFRDAVASPRIGRPSSARFVNYLAANMIRALGPDGWRAKWGQLALAEMKKLGFNTVGNWSEWEYARSAQFPYVRPMSFRPRSIPLVYRDFPDVFHAEFPSEAAVYAEQLKDTASDPAFIGYFLMNEPTWAFSTELPAAGMLYNTETCATRDELTRWLKTRYEGDAGLSAAWGGEATFAKVQRGRWKGVLAGRALEDLREFSAKMVEVYFQGLSKACRAADPNHLNLGMRWAGIPADWAVEGMKSFDVFSLNCYMRKLPLDRAEKIHSLLKMPVMVGEWHFGALDAGLPASGIGHVATQEDRGKAYRIYLEDAAADPYCVGVHWFTLYDQSALGRFDGENYNIGFVDICNRPYQEMGAAARASHERMYDVAAGKLKPYDQEPNYLPLLFL